MIANELSNEQGHIESAFGLLVDLMPDGVEAAKRIRMLPGEAATRIPIIVLTAKAEIDDKINGLDLGGGRLSCKAI